MSHTATPHVTVRAKIESEKFISPVIKVAIPPEDINWTDDEKTPEAQAKEILEEEYDVIEVIEVL